MKHCDVCSGSTETALGKVLASRGWKLKSSGPEYKSYEHSKHPGHVIDVEHKSGDWAHLAHNKLIAAAAASVGAWRAEKGGGHLEGGEWLAGKSRPELLC